MLILALATLFQSSPDAAPFDADARIREAVETVRPVAYHAKRIDWPALEAEMKQQAAGAKDTVDLLPAYQTLMLGLDDGHSYIQPPQEITAAWRERYGERRLRPDLPPRRRPISAYSARREIEHKDLAVSGGRTARLVVVPAFAGSGVEGDAYADMIFETVAGAGEGACGYIVDLRGNGGGNVWPMLAGLSGLLGDGPQGSFRDAEGQDLTYAHMQAGAAAILSGEGAGRILARAPGWRALPHLAVAPTAVLVDDGTASSGEGVALAFVGRDSTRSFGARTFGIASATNGYRLSDGVNLVVTVAMMTDRTGAVHPGGYAPDQVTPSDSEAVRDAAVAWLAEQPSCRGPSPVRE